MPIIQLMILVENCLGKEKTRDSFRRVITYQIQKSNRDKRKRAGKKANGRE